MRRQSGYPMNHHRPDKSRSVASGNVPIVSNKKADSLAVGFLILNEDVYFALPWFATAAAFAAISSHYPDNSVSAV